MIIFLDESKKINKWKKWQYIFWWLITTYKPSTIDKIYWEFLEEIGVSLKWWELKSTDRNYKDKIYWFYSFLISKWYMKNIEFCWIYIDEYKENGNNYIEMLTILMSFIIKKNKFNNNWFSKIQIIADKLKLNKNENYIQKLLNKNLHWLKQENYLKIIWFDFYNSKKFWWLQFADFIAWILRKKYIENKENLPYNFIEYFVNKEIKIIKILSK